MLADEGVYLGSESSFYRILKANNQLTHRGKAKPKVHWQNLMGLPLRAPVKCGPGIYRTAPLQSLVGSFICT